MSGSFQGIVHVIEETKTYGKNGFRKRIVVLEKDNGRFVNHIPFEFIQDACDTVDQLNVGDDVEIKYRLSGRRWQKDPDSEVKFFLSAEAVSFSLRSKDGSASPSSSAPDAFDENEAFSGEEDDVPF